MIDTSALREKVLDLAIRGKLVPQDPNDEPASVLLERIRAEKEQMVKDGKLKAKDIKNDTIIFKGEDNLHYEKFSDGTVKCIEDEIPFDVPDGWCFTRINNILSLSSGKSIKIRELNDLESYPVYGGNGINGTYNDYNVGEDTIVIGRVGFYCGSVYKTNSNAWVTDNALIATIKEPKPFNVDFLTYVLKYLKLGTTAVSSAQPVVSGRGILPLIIPVPPLSEQKRIIHSYIKILPYINDIESAQNSTKELATHIKSKILDLAIRGKLVPQNQDDEPASILLERIKAQKEELIKQGKIKRDKKESVIFKGDDNSYYRSNAEGESCIEDFPFELPNGWEWCNLSMIGYTNIGLTYKPTDIVSDGTMVLRSSNIVNGKIDLTDLVRVNTNIRDNQYIEENDILICARNGSKALVGKCAIFEGISERTSFGAFMAVYRSEFYKYVYYFLNSQIFRDTFMNDDTKQINQLTQDMIKNTVLTLPPFEEQKRIVDAIETAFEQLDSILNSI